MHPWSLLTILNGGRHGILMSVVLPVIADAHKRQVLIALNFTRAVEPRKNGYLAPAGEQNII